MSESPTDLLIRVMEDGIDEAEYVVVCVRSKEGKDGDHDFSVYSNEPDIEIYREMLFDAIGCNYMVDEEDEDD